MAGPVQRRERLHRDARTQTRDAQHLVSGVFEQDCIDDEHETKAVRGQAQQPQELGIYCHM